MGFRTNKIQIRDYELLLDKGFFLNGNDATLTDETQSCCEVYQYKVKALEFKMNKS